MRLIFSKSPKGKGKGPISDFFTFLATFSFFDQDLRPLEMTDEILSLR